jgi:hypothetical protein
LTSNSSDYTGGLEGVFRLNTNGSLDTTFAASHAYNEGVPITLALQPDENIMIGGTAREFS